MAAGMGASKVAQNIAAMYKTKALVSALKETGKSTDEIIATVNANHVKFPTEILESFKNIDKVAKTLQVGNEVVLDLISTIALNKMMNNGELLTMDVINSIVFAVMGGYVQKDFAKLKGNKDKIEIILKEFEQFGITREEANNILKAMDEISAGKKPTNDVIRMEYKPELEKIARKKAFENAQNKIMESTNLSKQDIGVLREYADIREESIQDLIIYCEKNGIKGYENLLYRCYANCEGDRYPTEVIQKKSELALRGLENKLKPFEVTNILPNN
jgi:hypothetical protein